MFRVDSFLCLLHGPQKALVQFIRDGQTALTVGVRGFKYANLGKWKNLKLAAVTVNDF